VTGAWAQVFDILQAVAAVAVTGVLTYMGIRATLRSQEKVAAKNAAAEERKAETEADATDVEARRAQSEEWNRLLASQRETFESRLAVLVEQAKAADDLREKNARLVELNEQVAREVASHLRTIAERDVTIAEQQAMIHEAVQYIAAVLVAVRTALAAPPATLPSPARWIEEHPAWNPSP
jgi:hypothetical protein